MTLCTTVQTAGGLERFKRMLSRCQSRGNLRSGTLETIPGVGPSIAKDLVDFGIRELSDLRGADPERMFAELCELRGEPIDRFVLYVFRCAVYYASQASPDRPTCIFSNVMPLQLTYPRTHFADHQIPITTSPRPRPLPGSGPTPCSAGLP
jgi:hypothetical protein